MTNQTNDFDADDGRVLAEFADMNVYEVTDKGPIIKDEKYGAVLFRPFDREYPIWQIQSVKDAVREKGLEEEFYNEFRSVMYERTGKEPTIASCGGMGRNPLSYDYDSIMMLFKAPPEAICKSILELEGD